MIHRKVLLAGIFLGSFGAFAVHAQQAEEAPFGGVAPEEWGVEVVELGFANAEEVAALLVEILPPGISVTPYYATNSLIFSGDRELLRALLGGGTEQSERPAGPSASPDTEAEAIGAAFIAGLR